MSEIKNNSRINRSEIIMKKVLTAVVIILTLGIVFLTGCGAVGGELLAVDRIENTGAIRVMAAQAEQSSALSTITVKKGECVIISAKIDEGSLNIAFLKGKTSDADNQSSDNDSKNKVYEEDFDDQKIITHDFEPGDYSVKVRSEDATGSALIIPYDKKEVKKNDGKLDELVKKIAGE